MDSRLEKGIQIKCELPTAALMPIRHHLSILHTHQARLSELIDKIFQVSRPLTGQLGMSGSMESKEGSNFSDDFGTVHRIMDNNISNLEILCENLSHCIG